MASPTTGTSNKAIKVRYYPIVVESEASYNKVDTSDEFYLVIHNEATDVLLDIIIKSVADEIAEALAIQISVSGVTAEILKAGIENWLETKFVAGLSEDQLLKAKFVEKIVENKKKLKLDKYTGHMKTLDESVEKPKRHELLVYHSVEIFDKIVDSNGDPRTLQQMIDILTNEGDLYKFLMEIGHMAG